MINLTLSLSSSIEIWTHFLLWRYSWKQLACFKHCRLLDLLPTGTEAARSESPTPFQPSIGRETGKGQQGKGKSVMLQQENVVWTQTPPRLKKWHEFIKVKGQMSTMVLNCFLLLEGSEDHWKNTWAQVQSTGQTWASGRERQTNSRVHKNRSLLHLQLRVLYYLKGIITVY